tara:strand:- start:941 stop:1141 length:201 start_codon:yes stop_codon:yes gene_type:complete
MILAIAISEMGLSPFSFFLIFSFGLFFLVAFAFTSKNMDSKGLLRVLYAKPLRNNDGKVEYRNEGD